MIILLQGNNVQAVPAYIQQGTGGEDVTIITPPLTEQLVLKVTPPSRMQISDIYCTKQFGKTTAEGNEIYTCKLPAEVTQYNGKALYQLCHIAPDGKTTRAEVGSFTIQKGIISEMPTSLEDLAQKSIDELYAILATYQAKAQQVQDIEEKIGLTEEYSEEAQPQWKPISEDIGGTDIIDALNKLNDKVNYAVDELTEADETLQGNIDAVDGKIGNLDVLSTADKETIVAAINSEVARAKDVEGNLNNLTTTSKTNLVSAINSEANRATGAENALGNRITSVADDVADNATAIAGVRAEVEGRAKIYALTLADFAFLLQNGSVTTDVTGAEINIDDFNTGDVINITNNYVSDVWFVKNYSDDHQTHSIRWWYTEYDGEFNPVPAGTDGAEEYELSTDAPVSVGYGYFLKVDADYEYINGQAHSASVSATQASASAERAEYAEGSASAYASDANQYAFSAEQARDEAITAKNDAITAKNDAVTAKNQAEQARDLAEQYSSQMVTINLENGTPKGSIVAKGIGASDDTEWTAPVANGLGSVALGKSTIAGGLPEKANSIGEFESESALPTITQDIVGKYAFVGTKIYLCGTSSWNDVTAEISARDENDDHNYATAVGKENKAFGAGSFAAGTENIAKGRNTTVFGMYSEAIGSGSMAAGNTCKTQGKYSTAVGYKNETGATAQGAFATGVHTLADHQGSASFGERTKTGTSNQFVAGQYNEINHDVARVTGWGSDDTHRKNIEELDKEGYLKVTGFTDGHHNEPLDKTIRASAGYEYLKTFDYALECVSKCVSAVQKTFTSRGWDGYGVIGNQEAWTGTDATKKEAEGQYFALYGTVSDDSSYKRVIIAKSLGRNTSVDPRAKGETVFYADESELVNRLLVALGVSESVERPTENKMLMYNSTTKSIEFADMPEGDGGMQMELLWTNANPTSQFGSQTIEIDLSDYRFVIVHYSRATTQNVEDYTQLLTVNPAYSNDTGNILTIISLNESTKIIQRGARAYTEGVRFAQCRSQADFSGSPQDKTNFLIPLQIYGIK